MRLGDRRKGSPGFRLQTNVEKHVELKTSIDAFATYEFCELPAPAFDLVAGPGASWKAIWPSLAVVGEPFRLGVVAEDMWGNPTDKADAVLRLVPSRPVRGLPESIKGKEGTPVPQRRWSKRQPDEPLPRQQGHQLLSQRRVFRTEHR